MAVETALYPPQLNTSLPQASDMVSEGDDHIRLTKTVIKTTFPNVSGAVSASQTEINYLTGVSSNIQSQINSKGATAGQVWGGTHDFIGAVLRAQTLAAGSNTAEVATTAFVQAAAFSAALPNQVGNAGKFVKTDGSTASWSPAVSSLNGETGDIFKNSLAGYNIQNFKLEVTGNVSLNTLTTAGQYRYYSAAANSPPGVNESVVLVSRGADTGSQMVVDYASGVVFSRGFIDQGGGTMNWSPWRRIALRNEPTIAVSGSTVDLSKGTYFVDSVSANKAYTFANQVPGSSFFMEITHTGGAISFGATVFPGGSAPSLATGYRHLLHFQLPSLANAWLGFYLGNYTL